MPDTLWAAFGNVMSPPVLTAILLAAIYGVTIGSIPGLTATMGVALMVPVTFFLDDITALAAIVTMEACAIFAGDIPATLVRIPGTPASAAYTDDAYAMTRAGRHYEAFGINLAYSVVGGLFGAVALIVAAPQLALIAKFFTTYEYFWLCVMGLTCAAVVSGPALLKGALAMLLGLLLATVGLSAVHGEPRFTLGNDDLINGINFIPAMIGLFGVSEVLRNVLRPVPVEAAAALDQPAGEGFWTRTVTTPLRRMFTGIFRQMWQSKYNVIRSSSIGTFIGALPGAGADIAAWIAYAVSRRLSSKPEEYGKGSQEGLIAAGASNNAALAGAWIPTLVFGIPGDSITAIVIGVLLMKNITPGPEIFTNPKQQVLVYGIYISFIVANLLMLPVGFVAIRCGAALVQIPRRILLPAILIFCIVGAYAVNGSYFDVGVMLMMGLLGFALDAVGVPVGPLVLGIVLGDMLEQYFYQSLAKSDSLLDFIHRPISATFAVICLALWLAPAWAAWRGRREGETEGRRD